MQNDEPYSPYSIKPGGRRLRWDLRASHRFQVSLTPFHYLIPITYVPALTLHRIAYPNISAWKESRDRGLRHGQTRRRACENE